MLLVDDSADTRDLFTFIFKDYGVEVVAIASAQEAFAAIKQSKFHVLISDICLPGEDGYSLIRRIRSLDASQGGQILAIAVSGFHQEPHDFNDSSTGFQLYLPKPVDPDKLVVATLSLIKQEIIA